MEESLTPQQLADIIFQRPDRLTKGILEKRSALEKIRDGLLQHSADTADGKKSALGKLKRKLLLEFNDEAPVKEEHPRSLRKAIAELRASGFSTEQANAINKQIIWGFWFGHHSETSSVTDLGKSLSKTTPALGWSSKAFLGVSPYSREKIPHENTVFTPETEELAYGEIVRFLTYLKQSEPRLFMPVDPGKNSPAPKPA